MAGHEVTSSYTTVPFSGTTYDHGGFYSPDTPDLLTVPAAGVYLVTGEVSIGVGDVTGGGRNCNVEVWRVGDNGSDHFFFDSFTFVNNGSHVFDFAGQSYYAAGDSVEVLTRCDTTESTDFLSAVMTRLGS